ncbi:unnamed protein product [Nippostrongylus brasiliensis]|uniref:CLIP-associating protein (inferred by orthology to a D. melanogaster protein) n=1 Tax=Nippostrongylus brasiliensis TaxID=27835 RepID=A0A0N4YSH2_NIPBR|nr:unnamed protein product [Nippostrongylus brasiliensis]
MSKLWQSDIRCVQIYSARELQSQMESIRTVLENSQIDWSQRVNSLKLLRSVLTNGGMDFEHELMTGIHSLEDALVTSVKDLRSQVCREACITVSFLCEKLETRIVRLCESLLPATIALIQNSAKIMSSSGVNACYFIIKHVEHPKLLPIVLSYGSSKSKEIRKTIQDLVSQIIAVWTPSKLEKSLTAVVDCIRVGISDADQQARASARNAYQLLDQHYPQQAQLLFQSLDPSKQRSLSGPMSAASSSQSINSEHDSLRMSTRPNAPNMNRPKTTNFFAGRSASEIDANAVRRAAAFSPAKSKLTGSVASRITPARPNVVRSGIPPSRQTPLRNNNSVNPPGSMSQLGGSTLNRGASANGHSTGADTRQLCNAIVSAFVINNSLERSHRNIPQMDIKSICDVLNKLLTEGNHKVKGATLNYLHELLQGMDQGSAINKDEVRSAVQKIFQWMEDPKNVSIKISCERVIHDFFALNTADFSTILSTFPPQWQEFAFGLLKKNKPSDFVLPRSPAASAPVRDNISDMSAQITDFVDNRVVMGPIVTTSNLKTSSPKTNPLNGSSRLHQSSNECDLSGTFADIDSTMYLKDDVQLQNEFIGNLLKELSSLDPFRRNEQNHALQTLQQMVSEGSLTTWEDNFKSIILNIFNVLAVNDVTLKRNALKLLTKICVAQAVSFYDLAEMTLFKVLDSVSEEENPTVQCQENNSEQNVADQTVKKKKSQLMNVADECLKTLATHFPLHVVIRATKPIIAQESDNRVGPALKMLTRLIESLDPDELTSRLPEIAPGVVNCYSNPLSSVRKSTVFCLVAMVNKLGREPINPYLSELSNSKVCFPLQKIVSNGFSFVRVYHQALTVSP